jgi:PAS domain S-box-containing protein
MLRIISLCIPANHDPRLVVGAAVICLLASLAAVNLFLHAREAAGARLRWLAAAASVFGSGVWATHFVAELAYRPGLPIDYDIGLTALSLLTAVAVAFLGMALALRPGGAWVGGLIIGLAIAAMHYLGMAALRAPADFIWNPGLVALSIIVGGAGASAALRVAVARPALHNRALATALLLAAVCGLHFTAMAALGLEYNPILAIPDKVADPQLLAVAIAAVTGVIITLALSGSMAQDRLVRQASLEAARLRESEDHLARAQKVARVGSIRIELGKNRNSLRAEWSAETYRIFGVPPDIAPTFDVFRSIVHPDDFPRVNAELEKLHQGGRRISMEFRVVRPDGREVVVHDETEVVVDDTGAPVLQISTVRDITDERAADARRKELERQLQHSQRLEALGTLAGGVAHELNNTLVPILALSQLMLEALPPADPQRGDLEAVVEASGRARDLVQQILAFSRKQDADAGQHRVDPAQVARGALAMMRGALPTTIQIVEHLADVPRIVGDANQLHQMIVNLMTNAAQALPSATGTITLGLSITGANELCLSVADTGIGMDAKTLDRAFEPFFTSRGVSEGSGLGLSVVHGIVSDHGGHIDVQSTPGAGSEFRVFLPIERMSAPARPHAAAA